MPRPHSSPQRKAPRNSCPAASRRTRSAAKTRRTVPTPERSALRGRAAGASRSPPPRGWRCTDRTDRSRRPSCRSTAGAAPRSAAAAQRPDGSPYRSLPHPAPDAPASQAAAAKMSGAAVCAAARGKIDARHKCQHQKQRDLHPQHPITRRRTAIGPFCSGMCSFFSPSPPPRL